MAKSADLSTRRRKDDPKRRCTAHRKDGSRCKRAPILGGTVCAVHGGSAPQVRAKAQRRLMAAVDTLMAELLRIAKSGESESVRLAAVNSALDRAGFSPKQLVQLDAKVSAWDDTFADGVVVITDDVPDDPDVAAANAAAINPAPTLRALPPGDEDRDPGEPLEGVVLDKPEPGRIPRRVVEALRATGYDI